MARQASLHFLLEETGYQLEQCLAGLEEATADFRVCNAAMSARETVAHLAEAYRAFVTQLDGGKHPWGSFVLSGETWPEMVEAWRSERRAAVGRALSLDDDAGERLAHNYITLHDAYHVGQLASLRLTLGGWDPHSIYRHG